MPLVTYARLALLSALESRPQGMTPANLARLLEKKRETVRLQLTLLEAAGRVERFSKPGVQGYCWRLKDGNQNQV